MPKKPRKTRIGSSAWSAQKARDKATYEANVESGAYDEQRKAKQQHRQEDEAKARWRRKMEEWREQQRRQYQEQSQQQQQQQSQSQGHYRPYYRPMSSARVASLRVLGLSPNQNSEAEIKHAYRHMALKYHPDKNTAPTAASIMKAVNVAFAYLTGKDDD